MARIVDPLQPTAAVDVIRISDTHRQHLSLLQSHITMSIFIADCVHDIGWRLSTSRTWEDGCVLQFGCEKLRTMPEFIGHNIRELVYCLLAHPQLSVREHAVKAYTLYIGRCDFQVMTILYCSLLHSDMHLYGSST